jgi:hypothetical protein
MSPALASSRPAMRRSSVDLPHPDGPTKTTNSPSSDLERGIADDLDRSEGLAESLELQAGHGVAVSRVI